MNSINAYTPAHLLIEMEGSFFEAEPHTLTLQDLQEQVDRALLARNDFQNSCLPSSTRHCVLWLSSALSLPIYVAMGFGALASASIAVANLINVNTHDHPEGVFLSSPYAEMAIFGMGALVMGGLFCQESPFPCIPINIIWNENQEILRKLDEALSDAYQRLAQALAETGDLEFLEALEQTPIPASHLLDAVRDDTPKSILAMKHLMHKGDLIGSGALASEMGRKAMNEVSAQCLQELGAEPEKLLDCVRTSPVPEYVLATMALAGSAPITDPPGELRTYLKENPQVWKKASVLMALLAKELLLHDFLGALKTGRCSGISQLIFRGGLNNG